MTAVTRQYRDIDLSFAAHPVTGDIAKKIGENAIIQSIRNLLLTGKYERLFQPRIHSRLKAHLFEPADTITSSAIGNEIRSVIGNFEPRVNLIEVNVVPEYDQSGYNVTLSFFIQNSTDPITVSLFLERIR
jgi:uncharacterized protein